MGAALLAAVAGTACSDSTAPLDDAVLALVADQAAAATAEQVGQMRAPGIPGWGFPRLTVRGIDNTPDCPLENGTFVCTHDRHGGVTEIRITMTDAGGLAQSEYDENTTASVRIATISERNFTREATTGFSLRESDHTVSGLEGDESLRIWSGTSSGESSRTGDRGSSEVSFSSEIDAVTIPHPRNDDSWPAAGTVRSQVTGSFTNADGETSAIDTNLVVDFNGTQFPDATLNGEPLELDLAARRGRMGRRGRG